MRAFAGVVIGRGERNLHGVRMARRDETVHERRGGIAEDLRRTGLVGGLREVVILHRNHEDSADSLRRLGWRCLRSKHDTDCDAGKHCCLAPNLSKAKIQKSRRVVCVIVVVWSSDTELSFHSI